MKHAISSSCNHLVERIYGEGLQDPFTSQKQVVNGKTTSLKPMRLCCPVDNNLMHPSTAPAIERWQSAHEIPKKPVTGVFGAENGRIKEPLVLKLTVMYIVNGERIQNSVTYKVEEKALYAKLVTAW
ncbi:uncharacterized protein [Montipora capricornis]|uniref:uncharacterized protein isoform X5 n=1 Tax=Montipora capricornis TaxID=246305 RepID=UPI0035F186EB